MIDTILGIGKTFRPTIDVCASPTAWISHAVKASIPNSWWDYGIERRKRNGSD